MTRAALLPTGADPFHIAYWLRHYRTWMDSVDELHVAVCGPIPRQVIDYIHRAIQAIPNATMHYLSKRTSHGATLRFLLDQTWADHIVLLEDDAFVRRPEVIEESFAKIEAGDTDIVATPRPGYASQSLLSIAASKFGAEAHAFWPCFVFVRASDLNSTDLDFDGTNWQPGQDFLGSIVTGEQAHADTFIWASYQLRDMGLKVEFRPAHRLDGTAIPNDAPWFHVGSLSQGHGNMWQNPRLTTEWYLFEREQCRRLPMVELPRRVAWWQRFWDHWDGEIPDYHAEYGEAMRRYVDDFGVQRDTVHSIRTEGDRLVTWAES